MRAASALLPMPARVRNRAPITHQFSVLLHRRRLPHIYPEGRALFLTWHLHGSLPAPLPTPPRKLTSGQAFVWLDRRLDSARSGPMYLRQPAIAQVIVDHLLMLPKIAPNRLMKALKGSTAREANRALGRTGEPFWQKESYDRWVRDHCEFEKIRAYIEKNPVKAGLVRTPEEFPWSSAGVEKSLDAARKSACATT